MNDETIKRLREYYENDTIYNLYKRGKFENISDFDLFCVRHCADIEILLEAYFKLLRSLEAQHYCKYADKCDEYDDCSKEDSMQTAESNMILSVENDKLKTIIYNANNFIKKYSIPIAYCNYIDDNGYKEYTCDEDFKEQLLEILKGDEDD